MNNSAAKPLLMGLIAMGLDKYYLQERDMMITTYFGVSCAAGNYLSQWVTPMVNPMVKSIPSLSQDLYDTVTITDRIVEVLSSTASVYILNKYILKNDNYADEVMLRMGMIAVSNVAATYLLEFINNKPLEFLTNK